MGSVRVCEGTEQRCYQVGHGVHGLVNGVLACMAS